MKKLLTLLFLITVYLSNGQTWTGLGVGTSAGIITIDTFNNKLYVAGAFDSAGGKAMNAIASWDGVNWAVVGSAISFKKNAFINALTVFNGNLYAAGSFDSVDGKPVNNIAEWTGSQWSWLGTGINGTVNALTVYNGSLCAGGLFNSADGIKTNNIALWNGTNWSAINSGIKSTSPNNFGVEALIVYNGNLYVGGGIDTAGSIPVNNIAEWDGIKWDSLGAGIIGQGSLVGSQVKSFAIFNGNLYAGGAFEYAGNVKAYNVAYWNSNAWGCPGTATGNNSTEINSLIVYGNRLYEGGTDIKWGNSYLEYWNDTTWNFPNGSGVWGHPTGSFSHSVVNAFGILKNSLYIGGYFDTAGGEPANNIVEWNDPTGINDLSRAISANIFPNPSPDGFFTFQFNNPSEFVEDDCSIEVYNLLGEKVRSTFNIQNSTFRIDISGQPAGIYLYRVTSEKGELVGSGKLVIE
ncbi:MAG TPA: T9SS type A sorting domain-containing protein [Bacteroidia bacterium]|jgi:hypothetical protein|nr:T9SS type A sorting domain-containing protein [Bacteroidia bacterium]